ncbi:hypothetical protein [Chromobacterium violaceum]|uniref:hypothetical protein n=1 Tax=Chromobacterium violaceum TaxID=536 RepID=UPI0012FD67B1|nr:hypothetical protein [Chromobacterium violaceum]
MRYDLPAIVPGLTAALQYGAWVWATKTPASSASTLTANDKHRLEVGYNANNLYTFGAITPNGR